MILQVIVEVQALDEQSLFSFLKLPAWMKNYDPCLNRMQLRFFIPTIDPYEILLQE